MNNLSAINDIFNAEKICVLFMQHIRGSWHVNKILENVLKGFLGDEEVISNICKVKHIKYYKKNGEL
ncbi:hypothetical protein GCM10023262_04630 [Bartonella pachyuromydis]|uniref:Uncharacterized protein n=1 Tax=Bartonella pachyuromydis TaxID=931097 RepID=A0ABP8VEB3_9HYPH